MREDPLTDAGLDEQTLEGGEMQVNRISVEVKNSKAVNEGAWKTVALGAEATLEYGEDRKEAQAALYRELAGEILRQLFSNGRSETTQEALEPPKDLSWCPIHECQMERREKNGKVWYSHKLGSSWCNGTTKKAKAENPPGHETKGKPGRRQPYHTRQAIGRQGVIDGVGGGQTSEGAGSWRPAPFILARKQNSPFRVGMEGSWSWPSPPPAASTPQFRHITPSNHHYPPRPP